MNKGLLKYGVLLGTGTIIATNVIPVSVYAYETQKFQQQSTAEEINKDQLVQEILKDIQQEMLPELKLERPKYEDRGAGGLIATLIAKYGITYVKKTLPKLIYKHVGKYLGGKISEQAFVRIFGSVVNWGTGTALEQGIAKALKAAGVDSKTANTVASVIVTVAWWFV